MFKNFAIWEVILMSGTSAAVIVVVVMTAFYSGIDYEKQHGPPGAECVGKTFREVSKHEPPANCVNGFWFDQIGPPFGPPQ
jgi:hypothetical protein